MIGFFEHQYLSYKKSHLRNLIALAKSDGHFHADEEVMIYKVGEKYGLKDRQIASLINEPVTEEWHLPDTHDQKMEQLYDLMQMVYADGIVRESEIEFCEEIVEKLGFSQKIVPWLLSLFDKGYRPMGEEWTAIKVDALGKFVKS